MSTWSFWIIKPLLWLISCKYSSLSRRRSWRYPVSMQRPRLLFLFQVVVLAHLRLLLIVECHPTLPSSRPHVTWTFDEFHVTSHYVLVLLHYLYVIDKKDHEPKKIMWARMRWSVSFYKSTDLSEHIGMTIANPDSSKPVYKVRLHENDDILTDFLTLELSLFWYSTGRYQNGWGFSS